MEISAMSMNGINADLSAMDLETALMMVQSQRAQLLEDNLREQLKSVNDRNNQMAKLNESINTLNATNTDLKSENVELTGKIAELKDLQDRLAASKHPKDDGWYGLSWGQGDDKDLSHKTLEQVKDAGLTIPAGDDAPRDIDGNGTMDAKGRVVQGWVDELAGKISALEAKVQANERTIASNEQLVADHKTEVDALGNTQQMEMLRLQSLTSKRNEAFDTMTNFIKKMQDNRSAIIGNMR